MGFFGFGKKELRAENITGELLLCQLIGNAEISVGEALSIPGFSGALNYISDKIAQLPVKLYERTENGVCEISDDKRLYLLNADTGDTMTPYQLKQAVVRDYFLCSSGGNVYIDRSSTGEIRALKYVDGNKVTFLRNNRPIHREYSIEVAGEGKFYPFDFVRIVRHSKDGITGIPLIEENKTVLAAGYSLLKYMQYVMKTGGTKKGFLKSNKRLTKEALSELKEAWSRLYSSDSTNNMMVLNDGIDYAPAQSTSVEMQLSENQSTVERGICMLFKLSPEIIAGKCTYQQQFAALETSVMPVIGEFEDSLNRDLLSESEKKRRFFAFDTGDLCRADIITRYNAYSMGLKNSFLQLGDVRKSEHLPPLEGMDDLVRLTLNDVLYNVKNGNVLNINSNTVASLSETAKENAGKEDKSHEN